MFGIFPTAPYGNLERYDNLEGSCLHTLLVSINSIPTHINFCPKPVCYDELVTI